MSPIASPSPIVVPRMRARKVEATSAIGLALLAVLMILAAVGPAVTPYDPLSTSGEVLLPPSGAHWFGTDATGRDIFSRVLAATRLDLAIAASAVAASFLIGTGLGALAGYFGGVLDLAVGRLVDTLMAFPLFVLAMGIVAALGNSIENVVYATIIINLPFYIRFARGEVAIRRDVAYVEAARAGGAHDLRILFQHILPNILPAMMVQISLNMGWAIMNAAALSFIGLGIRPPQAEWGIMILEGSNNIISGQWWTFVFPGLALMSAIAAFDMVGDALRDVFDPRARR